MLRYTYIACFVFGMGKQRRCFGSTVFKIQVFYFKYYGCLGLMSGCIVTLCLCTWMHAHEHQTSVYCCSRM